MCAPHDPIGRFVGNTTTRYHLTPMTTRDTLTETQMNNRIEDGVAPFDGDGRIDVDRRPLAHTAYEMIKRAIIRCDLEPGQQITEEQLAERFGLSRATVRPALKRLYQEQLVQTITRQRYVIPAITLKDAQDLFDLRLLLEPVAARRAAGRVDQAQLTRLNELCCAHYELGDRESAEAFLRANTEFHVTVA